jgi:oligoribonuclease NrnB/cAMP/cGMP phosphodiesterase (DHH superfamily)
MYNVFNTIGSQETVFMVDFSIQPFDIMLKLNNACKLIWIDHHNSAIEESMKTKK